MRVSALLGIFRGNFPPVLYPVLSGFYGSNKDLFHDEHAALALGMQEDVIIEHGCRIGIYSRIIV